ncbi:ABC transporter permease [Breoghania sp. L-A4]|uniref:ABC transporter permease n=1 Tax=Breoghania sp. L-A4 TaxID=2304600 RepID=UPI000E35B026|nr:ABC transporter permease [Breoghania sp. L-A4]AXS41342.1 ABC transporter permease [Breoghania sp. L-A4]
MRLINQTVSRRGRFLLGAIPFVALIAVYAVASHIRRAENPADKLLPSLGAMSDAFVRMAFSPEKRSGDYLLWADTADSLVRLGLGVAISALLALCVGIAIGFIPKVRAGLAPVVAAISLIPPLAVLPILFIVFGLGELAKVALIIIGIMPVMTRSMAQAVGEIPTEQIVKAQTLGASTWQMIVRVVLPQVVPKLITATRLALGPAWIFLISAEAIAATGGLGYRIFLVRRYLAMDIILPYVAWITCLAFLLDQALRGVSRRLFAWAHLSGGEL